MAYLQPARKRPNLKIITKATASRIVFEDGRASAVVYAVAGKGGFCEAASREVILCGGSINSPQLLMLSGVGPAAHLHQHGIPVVADSPGVGGNLQDHLDACVLHKCTHNVDVLLTRRAFHTRFHPNTWSTERTCCCPETCVAR